jgi:site-specific DNA recombinase
MIRAGIYARVSTREQAEEGYSIGSQIDKLTAYCQLHDYELVDQYIDPGFSGASLERPAMQRLLKNVKEKKLDVVIVRKLDRLSRSQKDILTLIEDVFLPNNCNFVSTTESFDTQTPMGRAMIGILSVFAQLERETIRERNQDGKNERAKTGKAMAWSNPPLGYNYVDKHYEVSEYEAAIVRTAYNLCLQGLSMNKIKKYIDEKFDYSLTKYKTKDGKIHLATIKRILRNPLYYGVITWKGNLYLGEHEALITEEMFNAVQKQLQLNAKNALGHSKNPFRSTRLLTGLLWCGDCGARMHAQSRKRVNNDRWYYMCYSVSKKSAKYITGECHSGNFDGETLDQIVYDQIRALSDNTKLLEQTMLSKESSVSEEFFEAKLTSIESKQQKLVDLYLDDKLDKAMLESKNKALEEEKQKILDTMERNKQNQNKPTKREVRKNLKQFIDIYETGELDTKKAILRTLIDRITVTGDDVRIDWTF